jgi:hypothetical protein
MGRIEPTTYAKEPKNKILMGKTIDFVFGIADEEFAQTYLSMFINDCHHAYNYDASEDPDINISCPKGIIERFYFMVGNAAFAICPEECPDTEHRKLYDKLKILFGKKMIDKNALLQEWGKRLEEDTPEYAEFKKLSEDKRRKDFIDFMTEKYKEAGIYNDKVQAEIEAEADKYEYIFKSDEPAFGGKKRKTAKKQNKKNKTRKNARKK